MVRKLIKDWEDLEGLENKDFIITVSKNKDSGYIRSNDGKRRSIYLSTHTFYEATHKAYQRTLRRHGFKVKLQSWG